MPPPVNRNIYRSGASPFRRKEQSAAAAVSISAAAEQQDDPEDIAAVSAAAAASVMFYASQVSSAAAKQQNQKENVASAVSSRAAVASASTVRGRHITHIGSSKYFDYTSSYESRLATVSRFFKNFRVNRMKMWYSGYTTGI